MSTIGGYQVNTKHTPPTIVDNLSVCIDCAMLIANDDSSGMDDDTEAACRRGIATEAAAGGHWALSGDENEESSFRWSACDCCQSRLGGDRVQAAVIYPVQS